MPKNIDVAKLLSSPEFMETWAQYPSLVEEEAAVIMEHLSKIHPTVPLTVPKARYAVVGTRQLRHNDVPRIKGTAVYTHDVAPVGMLYGAIRYAAQHAHAKIKAIDTSKAEALPGVRAVVTYKNVYNFGAPKQPIQARPPRFILQDEIFAPGDEVAGVAADAQDIAEQAVRLIDVEWEPLPSYFGDPESGLSADAPKILPDGNLGSENIRDVGDPAKAMAAADIVVEGRYSTQTLQHGPLEPKAVVMSWDGDQLTTWVSGQYLHGARSTLASIFGLPISKVRTIGEYMGGGFGDKSSPVDKFAYIAGVLSKMTSRPVRLYYSRREEFTSSVHKAANVHRVKAYAKRDGTLTAFDLKTFSDMGAHASTGSAQSGQEPFHRLYAYQGAHFEQRNVLTNRYRTGPMRDVNESSGVFSLEITMDRIAEQLGIDPVELRLKNVTGAKNPYDGFPLTSNGVREAITRGAETFGWKAKWHKPGARILGRKAHGVGMGCFASQKGSQGTPMSGIVKIERDGSVSVITGAQDVGAGQLTTMAMIAAEQLGSDLADTRAYGGDSGFTSDTGTSSSSRQTKSGGTGVRMAAVDAKEQLLKMALALQASGKPVFPAKDAGELEAEGSFVFLKADPSKRASFAQVMGSGANVIIGSATVIPPPRIAQTTFGATFTELEVDLDTGEVTVLDYVGAHDLGKIINLLGVEQQFDGGLLMGFGFALGEALTVDPVKGFSVNSTWENYPMATSLDVPLKTRPVWVESIDTIGPFGAKGMGEPVCTGPVASIPNAIYNAIGVRIYDQPITRDKILAAIAQMKPAS